MTQAAAAAEYKSNIGHDFTLADAYDEEFLEGDEEVTFVVTTFELVRIPAKPAEREDDRAPIRCAERPKGERVRGFLI